MEKIIENNRIETRSLIWEQLGYEASLDLSRKTIQRIIGTLNYYKYIIYQKG